MPFERQGSMAVAPCRLTLLAASVFVVNVAATPIARGLGGKDRAFELSASIDESGVAAPIVSGDVSRLVRQARVSNDDKAIDPSAVHIRLQPAMVRAESSSPPFALMQRDERPEDSMPDYGQGVPEMICKVPVHAEPVFGQFFGARQTFCYDGMTVLQDGEDCETACPVYYKYPIPERVVCSCWKGTAQACTLQAINRQSGVPELLEPYARCHVSYFYLALSAWFPLVAAVAVVILIRSGILAASVDAKPAPSPTPEGAEPPREPPQDEAPATAPLTEGGTPGAQGSAAAAPARASITPEASSSSSPLEGFGQPASADAVASNESTVA